MGSGQFVICEQKAIQREFPNFKSAFMNLDAQLQGLCNVDWKPRTFGQFAGGANTYVNTTILPPLFRGILTTQLVTFRQLFTTAGNQTLMYGSAAGRTIPEDFKIGLMGFALPNENQHLTEIKMQIGDRKYCRIDLEEIHQYDQPAVIFEEGWIVNEEEAIDIYGYIEGPIPTAIGNYTGVWQRIVPIGVAYAKSYDKVGGAPGSAI